MPAITFRWAEPSDYTDLGQVMFEAVRTGTSPYSESQRAAWVAAPRHGAAWDARLASQEIVIAEDGDTISGFMSLDANAYLDFAYILPQHRGAGLFRRLYEKIEARGTALGHSRIWVHASLMAAPAFERMGFTATKREEVMLGEETLERFEMEKTLTA